MESNKRQFVSDNGRQYEIHSNGKLFTLAERGGKGRGKVGEWYEVRGTIHNERYLTARIGGKLKFIHRIVAENFLSDFDESLKVDHINGDPSNNDVANLRVLTHAKNTRAYNKPRAGAKSRYRGVWWHKQNKKWIAEIHPSGKKIHIGCFDREEDAALAFNEKADELGWLAESHNKIEL